MIMPIKKLHIDALLPSYSSERAAGMDLHAYLPDGPIRIQSGERVLIKTGIAVAVPEGHYGRIAPRSGLAYKNGIDVMAGVVDEDYRGEVGVILINLGVHDFDVKNGDRIAQFVIERISRVEPRESPGLPDTNRGEGGFGSTGVAA